MWVLGVGMAGGGGRYKHVSRCNLIRWSYRAVRRSRGGEPPCFGSKDAVGFRRSDLSTQQRNGETVTAGQPGSKRKKELSWV